MKFLMQFSPDSYHFIPLLLSTLFSDMSICVLSLMTETSFTSIQNYRQNNSFLCCNYYVFKQQMKAQKVLGGMVANITRIQSTHDVLLD
jgi:hypothetical protein